MEAAFVQSAVMAAARVMAEAALAAEQEAAMVNMVGTLCKASRRTSLTTLQPPRRTSSDMAVCMAHSSPLR